MKNYSECLFEKYLNDNSIPFEYEPTWAFTPKTPDYLINFDGVQVICDVTEIMAHQPKDFFKLISESYSPIRRKIEDKRTQFKPFKQLNIPICLAIYSNVSPVTEPFMVQGAMFGDLGVSLTVNLETGEQINCENTFLENGKLLRNKREQNTTFSAILVLNTINEIEVVSISAFENPFAKNPLPKNIFNCSFDSRWEMTDGSYYSKVWQGESLDSYS